jgi:cytoskeletal protein RodZ
MERPRTESRTRARDAGLARLRRLTRWTIVGATALAGAFAAMAAHSAPGHKTVAAAASARRVVNRTQRSSHARTSTASPSTQTKASSPTQTVTPAPTTQAVAPAPTTVAPVAVTGGS